jgi:hypothetical protein
MIRLSEKYSVTYKNGYYIAQQYAIKGDKAKNKGEECVCNTQSYPNLKTCVEALVMAGEVKHVVTNACLQSAIDYKIKVCEQFITDKAVKEAAKQAKGN